MAFCLLSTPSTNQPLPPDSGQIFRHQYGISVADVPPREKSSVAKGEEKRVFSQAREEITVVETFQSGVISLSRERESLTHTSLLVV